MVTQTRVHIREISATRTQESKGRMRVDVVDVTRETRMGTKLLNNVRFTAQPGELVAIVGGSGAGKTTLLNAMAGVTAPSSGQVLYNGHNLHENLEAFRPILGYVPQDDIIHRDLPLEATLRYAARLRLPAGSTGQEKEQAVQHVIDVLGLGARANLPVKKLSGGQRKRASIGVELLTGPKVFFLDEPTSGLDPATANDLMRLLRRLADAGSTVVLTTHNIQDLLMCDKLVFLASDGNLAFFGPPELALHYFKVSSFDGIYESLANGDEPEEWARRFRRSEHYAEGLPNAAGEPRDDGGHKAVGSFGQWAVLTRRSFDMLWRSPLTLAILVGSPLMVIAMFAMLFKGGAFNPESQSPSAPVMIMFWVAFGGFFFGLTYGLLQICTEFPIFFRERLVNLHILPYVGSKITVLAPLLVLVCVLMLGVLRAFDRLPPFSFEIYVEMSITLVLSAFAALTLGLLTSALVSNTEQAMVAMPMLCFPQCLFAGAIVPVKAMAFSGKAMSALMSDRWSFQSLGHSVGLSDSAGTSSPLGRALLAEYGDSFSGPAAGTWLILAAFIVIFTAATFLVLRLKSAVD